MKPEKKYTSLREVYIKNTWGKKLPPLPRQILERVKISVQNDQGDTEDFIVSDTWYNKAIREKLKLGSQNQDTYYELIHSRCVDAGILPQGHEDINVDAVKIIYNYILKIAGPDKMNVFFEKFVDHGEKAAQLFVNELKKFQRFNIFDILSGFYGIPFVYDPDIFILRPFKAAKSTRGAAGPGEAFMSFFFFGKKYEVGDLVIPYGGAAFEIEIKKQKGRIGKDVNRNGGINARKLYPTLAGLDTNVLEEFIKKYNLKTLRDILLGTDAFAGISGVLTYPNLQLDSSFLNQNITSFKDYFSTLDDLEPYIGLIQMKQYFELIKKFDCIMIFTEKGIALGIERDLILAKPLLDLVAHMKTVGVRLKRKTAVKGGATVFDNEGLQILI
jgi:hypothetical protein